MRGPGVFRGYFGLPEATAAALAPRLAAHRRCRRAGRGGFTSIDDRIKDMYISGGENVYPAEVESRAVRAPGVADAAVIGMPDERWGEVGVAYIVAEGGVAAEELRAVPRRGSRASRCRSTSASSTRFPRNGLGKVQKQVLGRRRRRDDRRVITGTSGRTLSRAASRRARRHPRSGGAGVRASSATTTRRS